MNDPLEQHMEVVYRILRYLKLTLDKGLFFKKGPKWEIEIYSDADWLGFVTDWRLMYGYCFYVWKILVTWRSKKQCMVSRNNVEAEFHTTANAICQVIWIRMLLKELGSNLEDPVKFFCDNQPTLEYYQESSSLWQF